MFVKYQHVERLGTTEVADILSGECYVFPKLDGTNASIWFDDGIKCGSRKRELSVDDDNAGFNKWVLEQQNIIDFVYKNRELRLFGEWLVPHSLRNYRDDAWRNFYVFDVMCGEEYIHYVDYEKILFGFNIHCIPPLAVFLNPTEDDILNSLNNNSYLIDADSCIGEGVVVKRYGYENKFGRTTWAKVVAKEFKENKKRIKKVDHVQSVEEKIASEFVTISLVEKTIAKIENESGGFGSKDIPRLLHTVFYDIVREEIWQILKKFKNPTIDFKKLSRSVSHYIKMVKPELFR